MNYLSAFRVRQIDRASLNLMNSLAYTLICHTSSFFVQFI